MKKTTLYCLLFIIQSLASNAEEQGGLVINEVQVANIDMFLDLSFNYGAWIELYNTTNESISLSDMQLRHTDSEGNIDIQTLYASHGILSPKEFVNLWFDHNSKQGYYGGDSYDQIPFKLDADGGTIELLDSFGNRLDAVKYPAAITRCSWARKQDGGDTWGWTSQPTPAASNNRSEFAANRLSPPKVDNDGGVFNSPVTFHVTIPQGTTLYYTTDGSTPQAGLSKTSSDGIFNITSTSIYRFLLTRPDYLNSPVVTRTFLKKEQEYYLPIVSVTSNPDNFFDDIIGLYVVGKNGRAGNNKSMACNQNMDWERPVNVEYFVPDPSTGKYTPTLNQGASFSIFGGWTRFNDGDNFFEYKPSFKLKAEKVYEGENYFPYPVFESKPYIKLKHLLVRNGGQDQYARLWDAAIQELIRTSGMYIDCQAYQPAHIFLDGHPLGMFNLREASNRKFAYSNYGIDDDDIDQFEGEFTMKAGDAAIFNQWYNLSRSLAQNPDDDDVWQSICDILDVDEYCNYMAAEIYMGNLDWLRGGLKNIKGFRARSDDGKIHVVLFDVDGGFGDVDMLSQIINKGTGRLPQIFKNMLKRYSFKKQFIDAYCLMGGSVFEPTRCEPIIRKMAALTRTALSWEGNDNSMKEERLISRLTDRTNQHDKRISCLKSEMDLPAGYNIKISSNTHHARLLLGNQEIPTGCFDGTLFPPVKLVATNMSNSLFKGWMVDGQVVWTDSIFTLDNSFRNGKHEVIALYEPTPSTVAPIRINEVSSANDIYISEYGKKSDWLELYNTTDSDIDIAGMYLSDDADRPRKYRIAKDDAPTVIPAHGYLVVWCDDREGISQIHAPFKLSNTRGETVSIMSADGSWTDRLEFQPQGRWQSFGRYPDGGEQVVLLDRITIGESNRVNTHTEVSIPENHGNADAIATIPQTESVPSNTASVRSVEYFNTAGQHIAEPDASRFVLQRITFSDGTTQVRKVRAR